MIEVQNLIVDLTTCLRFFFSHILAIAVVVLCPVTLAYLRIYDISARVKVGVRVEASLEHVGNQLRV